MSPALASSAGEMGAILWDAAFKGMALLSIAGLTTLALQRASAAIRHLVWCLAMIGVLLLPFLSLLLPAWRVSWMPRLQPGKQQVAAKLEQFAAVRHDARSFAANEILGPIESLPSSNPQLDFGSQSHDPAPHSSRTAQVPTSPPAIRSPVTDSTLPKPGYHASAADWIFRIWFAGCIFSLLPLIVGWIQVRRVSQSCAILSDPEWLNLLHKVSGEIGLKRVVQLRCGTSVCTPLTWGALKPILLLPEESAEWSRERCRVVLLHELAHIKRWDWLTQTIAYIACAVYWFNPLSWIAARRMRIEREQACDDLVLRCGSRPTDYASELLQLATALGGHGLINWAAVPMARRSSIEERLLAILDGHRSRTALTRIAVVVALALLACVVVPVAMLKAADQNEPKSASASPQNRAQMPNAAVLSSRPSMPTILSGTVIDAVARKPIPEFTLTPGNGLMDPELLAWYRKQTTTARNGKYSIQITNGSYDQGVFLLEAPGYWPEMRFTHRALTNGNFELRRGEKLQGTVQDSTGQPVAGAQVAYRLTKSRIEVDLPNRTLTNAIFYNASSGFYHTPIVRSDALGRFELPAMAGVKSVLATHADGFVEIPLGDQRDNLILRLKPFETNPSRVDASKRTMTAGRPETFPVAAESQVSISETLGIDTEALRVCLSQSEIVLAGVINPNMTYLSAIHSSGMHHFYQCELIVTEWICGATNVPNLNRVEIVRIENPAHPREFLNGDKLILFLKRKAFGVNVDSSGNSPMWTTTDAKVSAQRYNAKLVAALKQMPPSPILLIQARRDLDRATKLFEKHLISQSEYDNSRFAVELAEAELTGDPKKTAEVKLGRARAELERVSHLYNGALVSQYDYDRAEFAVALAEAELSEDKQKIAGVKLLQAQREFERIEQLFKQGIVAHSEFDSAELAFQLAQAVVKGDEDEKARILQEQEEQKFAKTLFGGQKSVSGSKAYLSGNQRVGVPWVESTQPGFSRVLSYTAPVGRAIFFYIRIPEIRTMTAVEPGDQQFLRLSRETGFDFQPGNIHTLIPTQLNFDSATSAQVTNTIAMSLGNGAVNDPRAQISGLDLSSAKTNWTFFFQAAENRQGIFEISRNSFIKANVSEFSVRFKLVQGAGETAQLQTENSGDSGLIAHGQSEKSKRELLWNDGRVTAAVVSIPTLNEILEGLRQRDEKYRQLSRLLISP